MSGARAITIGALTDKGQVRELNEDSVGTPEQMGISDELLAQRGELLAVADGMGGHAAGEVASQEAIQTLYAEYYKDVSSDLSRSLRRAVEKANARIHAEASSDEGKHGMGTTLVAAVIHGNRLIVANVGDSRAYLFREGVLQQISRDHSWVAETLAAGLITEEQAKSHAYRNLITRALGQRPEVEVDLIQERLRAGDLLLLCSDGLTNEVDDVRIAQVLSQGSLVESVRSLVVLANRGGGRDNISAVVARVPSSRERLRAVPAPTLILGMLALVAAVGLAIALWGLVPRKGHGEVGATLDLLTATFATAEALPSPVPTEASPSTSLPPPTKTLVSEPTGVPAPADTVAPTDTAIPSSSPTASVERSPTPLPSASTPPPQTGVRRPAMPDAPEALYNGEPMVQPEGVPRLICLSGMAHSFAAGGDSSLGEFSLRLEDGRDLRVRVPPRGWLRQCRPWLPAGSEVTVCENASSYFRQGHHEQATVVVMWRQGKEPILWLMPPEGMDLHLLSGRRPVVNELLSLTNWNEELGEWMAKQNPDNPPGFDDQRILVYGRWGMQGDECRPLLDLASMEGGESGVFFWDGANYVHYTDWGQ